jgi:hypothetical protein
MSWTQGIQTREELPAPFLAWADGLGKGPLEYITWFEPDRHELFLDYGEAGAFRARFKKDVLT